MKLIRGSEGDVVHYVHFTNELILEQTGMSYSKCWVQNRNTSSIRLVMSALLLASALMLCSCSNSLIPEYPVDWPKLEKASNVDQLSGVYNNHCEAYTIDNCVDKNYRPTLAHVFHLELDEVESVNIVTVNVEGLELSFRDSKGKEIRTFKFGKKDGYKIGEELGSGLD